MLRLRLGGAMPPSLPSFERITDWPLPTSIGIFMFVAASKTDQLGWPVGDIDM